MNYDVVVVGGGPSGMASAIESARNGSKTLLIERNNRLGGILNQCIHNGFGLHYFKEELTGPEYAHRFIELIKETNVDILLNTFVLDISKNAITIINRDGTSVIKAKAIVLAMGSREKTAGSIFLTGSRPVGVYTAGQVQKMVNLHGKLPGKKVVILGSGDIGLIMARRLTFEGANVLKVLEIMPNSSGLERNITQCLKDFDIPLLFNTTITKVVGKDRLQGIYYANVDSNRNILWHTERFIECDTLLLSVGLTPEMDITHNIEIDPVTKGAVVDEYSQTSEKGVFSAGNVLHIHDLVDNVTLEAMTAGKNASLFAQNKLKITEKFSISCGDNIRYVLPKYYYKNSEQLVLKFRYSKVMRESKLILSDQNNKEIIKNVRIGKSNELQVVNFDKTNLVGNLKLRCE